MDNKPITLITSDPPASGVGIPLWASASIVGAAAVATAIIWVGVRRWIERRNNPIESAFNRLAASLKLREPHKQTVRDLSRDEPHAISLLVSPSALADAIERRLELPTTKRDARSLAELLTVMNGA